MYRSPSNVWSDNCNAVCKQIFVTQNERYSISIYTHYPSYGSTSFGKDQFIA